MLRITIEESEGSAVRMVLEGRVAGPWAEELERVWLETAQRLSSSKLTIDLRNVTYADASGKSVLGKIFSQTGAELVAGPLLTHDLAEEVVRESHKL